MDESKYIFMVYDIFFRTMIVVMQCLLKRISSFYSSGNLANLVRSTLLSIFQV